MFEALGSRLAAVQGDNVAELAKERASPRKLDRQIPVILDVDEIVAWRREVGDRGSARLHIKGGCGAVLQIFRELRDDFLTLALDDVVGRHGLGRGRHIGPAHHTRTAQGPATFQECPHGVALNDHSGQHHYIGRQDVFVGHLVDVLVDHTK